MKKDKLNELIEILKGTNPEDFDMGNTESIKNDRKVYCIIGLLYRKYHPEHYNFRYNDCVPFLHEFLETGHENYRYAWNDESYYIFGGQWAFKSELNTLSHAIYRIQKVIDGYKPRDIQSEVISECNKFGIKAPDYIPLS